MRQLVAFALAVLLSLPAFAQQQATPIRPSRPGAFLPFGATSIGVAVQVYTSSAIDFSGFEAAMFFVEGLGTCTGTLSMTGAAVSSGTYTANYVPDAAAATGVTYATTNGSQALLLVARLPPFGKVVWNSTVSCAQGVRLYMQPLPLGSLLLPTVTRTTKETITCNVGVSPCPVTTTNVAVLSVNPQRRVAVLSNAGTAALSCCLTAATCSTATAEVYIPVGGAWNIGGQADVWGGAISCAGGAGGSLAVYAY
jgi:hypothetical protein